MKILLYPFPKDMYGGERSAEHTSRMVTTVEVWRGVYRYHGVQVFCTGGLHNKDGLSLAQDMANQLTEIEPEIASYLVIGEDKSTHTGQAISYFKTAFCELHPLPEKIVIISNFWHLLRIGSFLKHYKLGIPIEKVFSPPVRPLDRWLIRTLQEVLLYLDSISLDRFGHRFDWLAEKRRADARLKP